MIHVGLAPSVMALALAIASIAYTAFALLRVLTLRLPEPAIGDALPSISVIKPLSGLEPELEENLATFCDQDYPRCQVIFAARDPADPALAVARALQTTHRDCEVEVVVGGGTPLPNPKVENLAGAIAHATGDVIVIADSDMSVDPHYLCGVAAPFADPRIGAVTALYGARSTGSFAARLGALFVNDSFAPSVLVAIALEPLRYCFGATMAVRRDSLARIGGIESLGGYLADDHMLGRAVSALGERVALAGCVPLTLISEPTLALLWARELRWARTIRAVRPLGFIGSAITYPLPFALAALLLLPSVLLGGALFAAAVVLRLALHYAAHRQLRIPGPAQPWLVPLRDLLSIAVWAASLFGRGARWRERKLIARGDGSLGSPTSRRQ